MRVVPRARQGMLRSISLLRCTLRGIDFWLPLHFRLLSHRLCW
jgi:hypothetical protein